MMFTKENLSNLIKNEGRDAVAAAVASIPDEEVRNALTLLVIYHQQAMAQEKELWRREHTSRIALETELKEAQARISTLEKLK